jgi:hypothetical protein
MVKAHRHTVARFAASKRLAEPKSDAVMHTLARDPEEQTTRLAHDGWRASEGAAVCRVISFPLRPDRHIHRR